ncbi:transposase [Bacteroides heparinolyticus]
MKYDKEFKLQALQLSDEIGVKAASEQLGLKYYTLTDWRKLRKEHGEQAFVGSGYSAPLSEKDRRIRELEAKLRETERANEILKEALVFFAKGRKK